MPGRKLNPEKLLHSKWTAIRVQNKRKHFIVTRLIRNQAGVVTACEIEAVLDKHAVEVPWQTLADPEVWAQGWS